MTELVNHATERLNDAAACAIKLLHHYGFDLGGCMLSQLLLDWQQHYPIAWIRLAAIEALYQGRYKAVSVEQILAMWQRRSQPLPHFNHEFERLVCHNLPDNQVVIAASTQNERVLSRSTSLSTQALPHRPALQLPSFEGSLPEADVMLALRTLHSKEMAALQEATLAEAAQSETPQPAETDGPPAQTYSYSLRSDELPSPTTRQESNAIAAEREEEQPLRSPEDRSSDVMANQGVESAAPDSNEVLVNDVASLEASIASVSSQSNAEPNNYKAVNLVPSTPLRDEQTPLLPPVGAIAKILHQLEHQELKARADLPAFGLTAFTLKPKLQGHLTQPYEPTWLTDPSWKHPIHQFTPTLERSNFHSKLKAVAQPLEEPQEDASQPDR